MSKSRKRYVYQCFKVSRTRGSQAYQPKTGKAQAEAQLWGVVARFMMKCGLTVLDSELEEAGCDLARGAETLEAVVLGKDTDLVMVVYLVRWGGA